ncbi:hypothetical protein TVAG_166630 [Trichomonas vaginalis G3]|uniref:Uncharacterized protein n=1 Tax=Trichomonas vaginalis (strain ATCC PRA-98 / G3) TaxID=412133 RepID=A2DE70_TRIV3|nr:hypothetical protein TVAGG3_0174760 [Trichomonas vaginalis G3]EAY21288.1 hypothetical protein TVAG_166630 [Trichomonas vaginalis G3]KAI5548862.1 hypothetical protein TVAGG3_0174760 [Trichomonas vaginalis G3]|eukprot:XP_001582274.1 hypothetical protein [Trichomonas vaginalis G3]
MLFLLLNLCLSDTYHKTVESFINGNVSTKNYDQFRFKFQTNFNLLIIYNCAGFESTVIPLSQVNHKFQSPYTYFVLRFRDDYVIIDKKPDCKDEYLIFTAIPNFYENENKLFLLNAYTNITIGPKNSQLRPNIDINNDETFKILFLSPVSHSSKLKFDLKNMKDVQVKYVDERGTLSTIPISSSNSFELKDLQSFILQFTTNWEGQLGYFSHVNDDQFDYKQYPLLYYSANISDFQTSFYPPMDINDGSPLPVTNEVCMCSDEISACTHCPNGLVPYSTESTNTILRNYLSDSGDNKCTIYVDGAQKREFTFEGLSKGDISMISLGLGANLDLKFPESPAKLSLSELSVTISSSTTISSEKLVLNNVNIQISGSSDLNFDLSELESDFDSLNNIKSIKTGSVSFVGNVYKSSIAQGITLKSPNNVYLPISIATSTIDKDAAIINDINIYGDANLYYSSASIVSTFVSSKYKYSFNGNNKSIILFGDFPATTSVVTGGNVFIYTQSSPMFTFTPNSTVTLGGETIMRLNNLLIFNNCHVIIDAAGIARVTLFDDFVKLSNREKEVPMTLPKSLTIKNEVNGGYLEIFAGSNIKAFPPITYNVYENTTTVLGNFVDYKGESPFVIHIFGVFLSIRTFDNYVNPSSVQILLSDNTSPSVSGVIIPFATAAPTAKDYSGPVAAGTIGTLLLIAIVVFIILFTACGNIIGLKTFGPWGSDPYKYKDDDQEGEIIDLNL